MNETRIAWVRFAAALAIALTAGCVGRAEVYRPQGPGTLTSHACGVALSTLAVPLAGDVEMHVTAFPARIYPVDYEQIALDIELLIGPGHVLVWPSTPLVVSSPSWSEPKRVDVVTIENKTLPIRQAFAPGVPLPGSDKLGQRPGYGVAFVTTGPRPQTKLPAVDRFDVTFPAIEVDGLAAQPVAVAFTIDRAARAWICD